MGDTRERSTAERPDRARHDAPTKVANTSEPSGSFAQSALYDGIGNRALLSLLRSGHLQRKARISQPGDADERQADHAAQRVMRVPETARSAASRPRHSIADRSPPGDFGRSLHSSGQPLDTPTRGFFEDRFGHDFSNVRIHSDASAARSAEAVAADAFTTGSHIVFGAGQHRPDTMQGRELLAHELAHVVQQSERNSSEIHRQPDQRSEPDRGHDADPQKPAIATITAYRGSKNNAMAVLTDSTTVPVKILENELEVGDYVLERTNDEGEYHGAPGRFVWWNPGDPASHRPKYAWLDKVRVVVRLSAKEKFDALPTYIRDFLTTSHGKEASAADLEAIVQAGEILAKFNVTPDDLALEAAREYDAKAVGRSHGGDGDPVRWALDFVTTRVELQNQQRENWTTLAGAAMMLEGAPIEYIRRIGVLQILNPDSDIIGHIIDLSLKKWKSDFTSRDALAKMITVLEDTLVIDLRRIAVGILDETEARLIRIDRQYVGMWKEEKPASTYVGNEARRLNQDPDVKIAGEQRDAAEEALDEQKKKNKIAAITSAFSLGALVHGNKEGEEEQQKLESELQEKDDAYAKKAAEKSPIKLSHGTDVKYLLSAKTDEEAQTKLTDLLYDGRTKVNRTRERIKDRKVLYAADKIIDIEKSLLTQELGPRAKVANELIDRLARERRSQTSIWDELWKVLEFVAMFIPGPIGLGIRFVTAAVDANNKLADIAMQRDLYVSNLRTMAPDPSAATEVVGEFLLQTVPDVAMTPMGAVESAPFTIGKTAVRQGEREVVDIAGHGAGQLEGQGVDTAAGSLGHGDPAAPPSADIPPPTVETPAPAADVAPTADLSPPTPDAAAPHVPAGHPSVDSSGGGAPTIDTPAVDTPATVTPTAPPKIEPDAPTASGSSGGGSSGGGSSGGGSSGGGSSSNGGSTGGKPPSGEPGPDPRGIDRGDGVFEIRGTPAAQPTKAAVAAAENEVEQLVRKKYGQHKIRDLSAAGKDPYAPGVDRLFIIGEGEGAVLLEVDAKLSIQEAPVVIKDVSAFESAAKTGGKSRLELLDAAVKDGRITPEEYQFFRDDVEQGLVLEEVHGFGAVSGISNDLKAGQTLASGQSLAPVTYVQGEQFAHITTQVEARESQALSTEIEMTLVAPAVERRTGRQISNEIFKDFQKEFGLTKKPRTPKPGGTPPKKPAR
ncbi:MAG TPA: DUF4157 domain-containing protein [Stellaceae bacterium]|jgi:uncharacterized membrane protein YgcG|nr:DUF4157 domain-containing protein [Stellaceae bacterium]